MNYDQTITALIDQINQDKSIIQPWRNKAKARLEEAQAFVRMGKTSTPAKTGDPFQNIPGPVQSTGGVAQQCTCKMELGIMDPRCSVHGL